MTAETSRKIRTENKRLFVQRFAKALQLEFALGSVTDFPTLHAQNLANTRSCPTGVLNYEPMFVQKEKKSSRAAARAADALDLVLEFATLGEYGLEYPEPVRSSSRRTTTPDVRMERISRVLEGSQQTSATGFDGNKEQPGATRHRHGAGPQKHRHGRRPCRPGRTRVDLPGWGDRPGHEMPGVQPGRRHKAETGELEVRDRTESRKARRNRPTADFPEVLRPPRIRLEAA